MKVRFTPAARSEFLEAIEFIRRDRPNAAAGFHRKANETLKRLGSFPESGRRIPEFPDLPIATFPTGNANTRTPTAS